MKSKRTDEESDLRRSEEQFRLVVDSSPAAMVIIDQGGRIVLVNQQAEKWFGYDRSELLAQDVEILIPHRFHAQHRPDRDGYLDAPLTRPMKAGHDLFARRKDGSEFPVDVSLHPMLTNEGTQVMAYIVDLTERKQTELESQRNHATQRLALLGQLAAGVAHEIRNPLGVIRNAAYYLQMIRERLDEDAQASITEIQQEVERANLIVGDLLDYARDPPQQAVTFDLVARIRKLADNYQQEPFGVSIEIETADETMLVDADPDQVDRVLMNLIRNGVQASDEAGRISVSLRRDASSAIIEVSDDGVGVDDADRPRIFEPLFTTKAKGIGLGLAVSKRYAEHNGGSLELVDGVTRGAKFRLTLPLAMP